MYVVWENYSPGKAERKMSLAILHNQEKSVLPAAGIVENFIIHGTSQRELRIPTEQWQNTLKTTVIPPNQTLES